MFYTFLLKQVDSVFLAYEILVYSYVIFLIKLIFRKLFKSFTVAIQPLSTRLIKPNFC